MKKIPFYRKKDICARTQLNYLEILTEIKHGKVTNKLISQAGGFCLFSFVLRKGLRNGAYVNACSTIMSHYRSTCRSKSMLSRSIKEREISIVDDLLSLVGFPLTISRIAFVRRHLIEFSEKLHVLVFISIVSFRNQNSSIKKKIYIYIYIYVYIYMCVCVCVCMLL